MLQREAMLASGFHPVSTVGQRAWLPGAIDLGLVSLCFLLEPNRPSESSEDLNFSIQEFLGLGFVCAIWLPGAIGLWVAAFPEGFGDFLF